MDVLGPESVVRLWDEHGAALVLFARQLCDVPEDVVQEAFLQLVHYSPPPVNPKGWLYRVVRNRALNAARSNRRRRERETASAEWRESWFHSDGSRLDAAEAAEALRRLPVKQREVIVARLWGGLSFEEIARLRDSSVSSAHRCYHRGLNVLRERLDSPCQTKKTKTTKITG